MTREELINWARTEAERLRKVPHRGIGDSSPLAYADVAPAFDFLTRQAPGTHWEREAQNGQKYFGYAFELLEYAAKLLDAWADYVEAGLANAVPIEVEARVTAASDLMEQVDRLLDDPDVHVAAPVVLAGAALEEFLRALLPRDLGINGKPGLDKYGAQLKKSGVIGATDAKDITAWAGQRNDAAHGHFEQLNRDRARIMADGINLFMRRHAPGES